MHFDTSRSQVKQSATNTGRFAKGATYNAARNAAVGIKTLLTTHPKTTAAAAVQGVKNAFNDPIGTMSVVEERMKSPEGFGEGMSETLLTGAGAGMLMRTGGLGRGAVATVGNSSRKIAGITEKQLDALVAEIKGIEVDGQPAFTSMEAFGSRAGSKATRSSPGTDSDLDLLLQYNVDAPFTLDKLGDIGTKIDDISDRFKQSTGVPLHVTRETDTPAFKERFKESPYIRLDEEKGD